jgi:hypothetical protein
LFSDIIVLVGKKKNEAEVADDPTILIFPIVPGYEK